MYHNIPLDDTIKFIDIFIIFEVIGEMQRKWEGNGNGNYEINRNGNNIGNGNRKAYMIKLYVI